MDRLPLERLPENLRRELERKPSQNRARQAAIKKSVGRKRWQAQSETLMQGVRQARENATKDRHNEG